MGDDKNICKNI
ncbi:Protein of unknown function [Propionibacterium freudenreichii]|uniref:Uncharacterized protein n=2 Tax=Propionibacterium freudenreichii TaxID=1744 RepID=D7GFD7_PROFC|nr:Hypothetical protein PFREUD_17380 [Propionibacterium freudenreichii subsp. shermanii CIRM-BIA1]CDP48980.1 Protein of unknown function [Propionibacterium freudenreichii subsp. freudenreichii]CEG86181.1 Protein of unknown function [Propionibacterium freudenreichii]CEG87959.1 Protein of unknown function [Propionibacterium freudenreichii]CEG91489.1 Protein of unknown function [Propionibacterium freudenreichii]